ncbi:unnamed protein product [Brassicogethes aeneus]|uniref:Uncharacterized protein n=1 Tax=Brassicogethes aeneus TaxID=1431903 RepID=A0A9P0B8V4_BRAAE|nr:unnamed protein product [Brassicogethes aeneus]
MTSGAISISSNRGQNKSRIIVRYPSPLTAFLIFKEIRTDDDARPKSTPDSNLFWMQLTLYNLSWVCFTPNPTVLLNKADQPKMILIAKNDFLAELRVCFQML